MCPFARCQMLCLLFKYYERLFGHYALASMVNWSVWIQTCLTKYLALEFTISLLKDADNHQKLEEPTLSLSFPCHVLPVPKG